jgi:hypothetical protein
MRNGLLLLNVFPLTLMFNIEVFHPKILFKISRCDFKFTFLGFFKQPRIFITTPRFSEGVPITLGTVSNYHTFNGPLIDPYPDYSWHVSGGKDCNTITSVYRMMVSVKTDRLSVLFNFIFRSIHANDCGFWILVALVVKKFANPNYYHLI